MDADTNFDQPSENLLKFNQNLLRTTSRQFVKILSEHLTSGISFAECDQYLEKFKIKTKNGNSFKVWEGKSRGVPIWNRKMFEEKLNYIHFNPVKAKMVKNLKIICSQAHGIGLMGVLACWKLILYHLDY